VRAMKKLCLEFYQIDDIFAAKVKAHDRTI